MTQSIWTTLLKFGAKCSLSTINTLRSLTEEMKLWEENLLKLLAASKQETMLIIVQWKKSKILKSFYVQKEMNSFQSKSLTKKHKAKTIKKIKKINKKNLNFYHFINKKIQEFKK